MTEVAGNGAEPPADGTNGSLALDVRQVTSGYERTVILRDVSIAVPTGHAVALLGPNGAGKTTLLRTISGSITPYSGTVHLLGQDVTRWSVHRRFRSGLCHVPEGRGVFPSLTVRENLLMQAPRGTEATAPDRAVSAFPVLGRRLSQVAGTMSGGEQQMLAMASAYVRSPRVVLVDEASLGLAPIVIDEIFSFLASLVLGSETSLLIVDQFAVRALQLATTAYVLRRGEVVFSGRSSELRDGDLFSRYVGS